MAENETQEVDVTNIAILESTLLAGLGLHHREALGSLIAARCRKHAQVAELIDMTWARTLVIVSCYILRLPEASTETILGILSDDSIESVVQESQIGADDAPSSPDEWVQVNHETWRSHADSLSHAHPHPLRMVLEDLLGSIVLARRYDARARCVFRYVAEDLDFNLQKLEVEAAVRIMSMSNAVLSEEPDEQLVTTVNDQHASRWRWVKVAAAAASGGAAMLYTGGLASPAITSALATLGTSGATLTSYAALTTEALGVNVWSAIFGGIGATSCAMRMTRRTAQLDDFKLHSHHCGAGIPLEILVPGWCARTTETESSETADEESKSVGDNGDGSESDGVLVSSGEGEAAAAAAAAGGGDDYGDDDDGTEIEFVRQTSASGQTVLDVSGVSWLAHSMISTPEQAADSGEVCTLAWASDTLRQVGDGISRFAQEKLTEMATHSLIGFTPLHAVSTAVSWPLTVLGFAGSIDNPFTIMKEQAVVAGDMLAGVIASQPRPVTLVGYSAGALVIFHCLEALARRDDADSRCLVESVILCGAAISAHPQRWRAARSQVAGRFVNVYCENDWYLRFLYRYHTWEIGVAGLMPIADELIENVDVSGIVMGHLDYPAKLTEIRELVDLQ